MNCSNYWGKPDGSIDFCERNYEKNMYIAEYWNTISASVYFLIGMLWVFTKYKKVAFSYGADWYCNEFPHPNPLVVGFLAPFRYLRD